MSEPRSTIQLKYQLAGTGAFKAGAAEGPVVLVVDDDADMTRFITAILSSRGMTTVAAYDAVQGMLVAQRQQPRLIIVDWHMPAGGGPQLLRKLRGNLRTSGIPILVITADDSETLPTEAAELGARAVLRKPLDAGALLEIAANLVS